MFRQLSNKHTGLSMVEVIIAAVIFTLAAAGLFATISTLRKPAEVSSEAVTAAFIGKRILETFRKEVDATVWSGGPLDPGASPYTLPDVVINGLIYNATYTVTDDPYTSARKVKLTIGWP